jgi:hypothetical protein
MRAPGVHRSPPLDEELAALIHNRHAADRILRGSEAGPQRAAEILRLQTM